MTYAITFTVGETTVTLQAPEPFDVDAGVITNVSILLSGERSVQTSTETGLDITFKCYTDTYSHISGLRALIGSSGTLSIDGTEYGTCYISKFSEREWAVGEYEYTVGFVRDTTA
jgi:hypothetical protein